MAKEPENKKDATAEAEAQAADEKQETSAAETVTLTKDEFEQVKQHIDKLEAEKADLKLMAQRIQAEFDNFRKRNASVHADSLDEGVRNTLKELLPVLDNFERAFENTAGVDEGWLSGIKLVKKQLWDVLGKMGLEEIPTDGQFDPNMHEAVMQEEAEDAESGSITMVFQKGYKVKNRIIRHSMVKVAK